MTVSHRSWQWQRAESGKEKKNMLGMQARLAGGGSEGVANHFMLRAYPGHSACAVKVEGGGGRHVKVDYVRRPDDIHP